MSYKSSIWLLPAVLVVIFACTKADDIDWSPAPEIVAEETVDISALPLVKDIPPQMMPPAIARPAWEANAVAPDPAVTAEEPLIAIVIDDMGLNRRTSLRTVGLQAQLTLAYLPYARDLDAQTAAARASGHELLVHVPMEPESGATDPGPNHLHTGMDATETKEALRLAIAAFDGHAGINNHMGSKITKSAPHMQAVAEELKAQGLLFLDSRTTAQSVAEEKAHDAGIPATSRDVFLDDVETTRNVERELARAESIALRTGSAIAIGHPKTVTLDALEKWIPQARARGFRLVPLTSVIARRAQDAAEQD